MNIKRYSRQTSYRNLTKKDQKTLLKSKVAIIGLGAIGTAVAELLTRAGIGTITLIDRDFIEKTNLQRQLLYDEKDIGKLKTDTAKEKLQAINSDTTIESKACDINHTNIQKIVEDKNLIIDCTDNMETRFLINDCSMKHSTPWIYTAAAGSKGVTMNIIPKENPCFRCIFSETPKSVLESCETVGILNSASAAIGAFAAVEAIKILTKKRHSKTLTYIDVWNQHIDRIEIKKRKGCPSCNGTYEFLERKKETLRITHSGKEAYHIVPAKPKNLDLTKLFKKMEENGKCSVFGPVLHFKDDSTEFSIFKDGRATIKNIKTKEEAKKLYERFVGN